MAFSVMSDRQLKSDERDMPAETARKPSEAEVLSLVRQHYAALYRYAFRLSGNAADAEDLTQQTFLQALAHLQQVRDPDRVGSWLYSILRRCFLRQARYENKQVDLVDFDLEQLAEKAQDTPIDEEQLQHALAELPAEFRVVLLMFYFEERSYKEIAAELELPVGTVMSRLSRAKGHLRAKLLARESEGIGNAGSSAAVSDKTESDKVLSVAVPTTGGREAYGKFV